MSRLRDQRGFTATEVLVATALFLVILAAVLAPMDTLWRTSQQNERQNEAQDLTRRTIDRLAADLRGAGGQDSSGQQQTIEKATSTDLVFRTADPLTVPSGQNTANIKRVRYCLTGTTLVRQEETWTTASPPALSATAQCPGATPWVGTTTVATSIVNTTSPCPPTASTPPCPFFTYDSGTLTDIEAVGLDVIVDPTPGERPAATELRTSVTLRNQVDGQ